MPENIMMDSFSFDVSEAQFDQVVLQGSRQVPVLVDFWAPWCGPCRTLTPILEKLAAEYAGRFLLAKVNSDESQRLSRDFVVRSIPSVKAFVNGQLVDEFVGVLPESALREFIERLMPAPAELLRRAAAAARTRGDSEESLRLLREAAALTTARDEILGDEMDLLLALGRTDDARETAKGLSPLARQDSRLGKLLAQLEFAPGAAAHSRQDLEASVAAHPEDLASRQDLARLLVAEGDCEPALEHLLEIVRRDRRFGDDVGRKTMLAVFNLLEGRGELVNRYRRLLASALN